MKATFEIKADRCFAWFRVLVIMFIQFSFFCLHVQGQSYVYGGVFVSFVLSHYLDGASQFLQHNKDGPLFLMWVLWLVFTW